MIWIYFVLGTVLSAMFYRLGGAGKHGQWYAFILDGKLRDWGCPLVVCLLVYHQFSWHWTIAASFVLMWGALSTYWKKFVVAKPKHWIAHGLGVALAMFPTAMHEGLWEGFIVRCFILPVAMMVASEAFENPITDELWRGGLIVATLPILLF